tara:strand:+ start:1355 stop:1591 length:237 start_codon:yes stop_codon:yes gene_type:complete
MKKPKIETSDDILGEIRRRQNPDKLRKFLHDLNDDYRETDLYKLGFEDGQDMGKDLAEQKHAQELRAIRTILDAMIGD